MSIRDMVITSQLLPPDRRRGVLNRRRLAEKLGRALDTPLTLVLAGTGYGKSTALAGLTGSMAEVYWYTVSESERDPLLFLAHLLAAFEQGSQPWGKPFLERLEQSGGKAVPGALTFLLNTLTAGLTRDVVLVLDDYHLVADVPEVAALVERLVDYRPPRLHIVLSGRQVPAWPALTRWRVKGQVLTIDRTDLAFSESEIAALFQEQYGVPLSARPGGCPGQRNRGLGDRPANDRPTARAGQPDQFGPGADRFAFGHGGAVRVFGPGSAGPPARHRAALPAGQRGPAPDERPVLQRADRQDQQRRDAAPAA